MEIMFEKMFEKMSIIINAVAEEFWIFLLLGIVHILLREYKISLEIIRLSLQKKLNKKNFLQKIKVFQGYLKYLAEGTLFSFGGFIIIQWIDRLFNFVNPSGMPPYFMTESTAPLWNLLVGFSGMLGVLIFLIGGAGVLISAGNKWILNTARILITLNIVFLITIVIAWQIV